MMTTTRVSSDTFRAFYRLYFFDASIFDGCFEATSASFILKDGDMSQ